MNDEDFARRKPSVAVIGAGPAGLMAAETVARGGASVTIYDRMPSPGRKLLLAGRGGLNLTHSEGEAAFRARYGAAAGSLRGALDAFGPQDLRHWCGDLGIDTFVGTSGRVFPASFKTSPLLRAWLRRLESEGVRFVPRHRWIGWGEDGGILFETPDGTTTITADACVLALGGATWPQLGSDGRWVAAMAGIEVAPLEPANCGVMVDWSEPFRQRFAGQPLKSVAVRCPSDGGTAEARGDVVVTDAGLEGGPVYALAAPLRSAISRNGTASFQIILRPDLSVDALVARLAKRQAKQSFSTAMRKTLGLTPVAIALLREAERHGALSAATLDPPALAALIDAVPVRAHATMPIERAISTAGGLRFAELDEGFMLRRRPGTFVAGEMLDWEAPTGGYLLQACFATGRAAGQAAVAWCAATARR